MRIPSEVSQRRSLVPALILAAPVFANDGFGGLPATGRTFREADAVAMEQERLFIGIDTVAVDQTFRNSADSDVTGEAIFPLPPVGVRSGYEAMMNLPDDLTRPDRQVQPDAGQGRSEERDLASAEGVRKTGPTTFVIEKTDCTPDRDLEVLIVQQMTQD